MATSVKMSDKLVSEAKRISKVENRSVAGQIEYWAKVGKASVENSDLTFDLIHEIMLGLEEKESEITTEYIFEE